MIINTKLIYQSVNRQENQLNKWVLCLTVNN